MGKQRYWLFKTVFTENNQFERIIPATGDVWDKRSVSPLCSTPRSTPSDSHRLDARLPSCSTPLIISRLIEIGKGFDSPRNPIPTCSIPFCRCLTTMTSSTTKLQLHRTCGWNFTDGKYGKYGDGNFLLVSFFFFR